jgi:peptidoglycan endopeptidase LytE
VATLRAANGIRGDLIRIGQALQVPDSGERPAPEAESEAVHRVRRGESLSRIARLYGTTVAAITTANGLSGDLIRVGQLLRVTGN